MTKSNDHGSPVTGAILVLGGTRLARALADALAARGVPVISSLAGRTRTPLLPAGDVRTGGFGGAERLARYLEAHRIGWLVDATHPFAARISANAALAAGQTGTPILRLEPLPWRMPQGGNWTEVADLDAAARALPGGAGVFLAIGRQGIDVFFSRPDCRFVARMIEPPETVPPHWTIILDRGPFSLADETALLAKHRITHLVSKNAGGPGGAKLTAAARRAVAVVMVARPYLPPIETCRTVGEVLARIL